MSTDRLRLIKLIHVAKRELKLDEPTYREILRSHGGSDSTSDMSVSALTKVVNHLKRSGFVVRSKAAAGGSAPRIARPMADDPQSRKIRALWLFLHQVGQVNNPSEVALARYCKRITGVDALQFASFQQANRLIETLKKWAVRTLPNHVACARETLGVALSKPDLIISGLEVQDIDSRISIAMDKSTYDNWYLAWVALARVLHRVYPADHRFGGVEQ